MSEKWEWNGHSVRGGGGSCALVKYLGPTEHNSSRWKATIMRDAETKWSATASYNEGPIVAVKKLLDKQNLDWTIKGCAHAGGMDSTYVVWFGYK